MIALPLVLALSGAAVTEAERLAGAALAGETAPAAALAGARRALSLTADFDPTDFVKAGRKGEVVEDEYVAARGEYRRHRARLYEAVGVSHARLDQHAAAARYLRRASVLDPTEERAARLSRSLLAVGRAPEALALVLGRVRAGALAAPTLSLVEQAVDAAGRPSAQVEIDRARLLAVAPTAVFRDGPVRLAAAGRLSSGAPLDLASGIVVLYAADRSCRSCSDDLQELKRAVPPGTRVVLVPPARDADQALRQIVGLYHYDWPLFVGGGAAAELGIPAGSVLVVARGGWAAASVKSPFMPALAAVLEAFAASDVRETLPRPAWNTRPVDRAAAAAGPPGLLPEGLAPGEDEPAPEEFKAAVAAYRAGRAAEALRLFEALEAKGDGWLLGPEARLDRALCLAALGRRDEARRLLLKTGDSRFQDEVDKALETVAARRGRVGSVYIRTVRAITRYT